MLNSFSKRLIIIWIIFHISTIQVYSETWNTKSTNSSSSKYQVIKELDLNITWYYTPLPNQKEYITWSFESEVKLNWEWLHMASWKQVYTWAIAAPSSFPFWSKIYIEWYWVWIVEDRWWSVVDNWAVIIDIRMWAWDEWLNRTRNWGRRFMKWYHVSDWTNSSLILKSWVEDSYKYIKVEPNSDSEEIKKLQLFFREILFYNWEIDWNYESIKDILIKYQIQKWIVWWYDDESSWYYWPKTIKSLENDFWIVLKKENSLSKEEKKLLLDRVEHIKSVLKDNYNVRVKSTLEQIKIIKQKSDIATKTKLKLEYLEIIL